MKKQTIIISTIFIIACLVGSAYAYSTYIYHKSNQASGDVTETNIDIDVYCSLTLTPTQVELGQPWTITATLDNPQANIAIVIKEGSTVIGTVYTDSNGAASLTITATKGHHDYFAYPPGT